MEIILQQKKDTISEKPNPFNVADMYDEIYFTMNFSISFMKSSASSE